MKRRKRRKIKVVLMEILDRLSHSIKNIFHFRSIRLSRLTEMFLSFRIFYIPHLRLDLYTFSQNIMDKKFTLSNENSSVFFFSKKWNDDGRMKEFSDNSRNVIHIFPLFSSVPLGSERAEETHFVRYEEKGTSKSHIGSTLRGNVCINLQEISSTKKNETSETLR